MQTTASSNQQNKQFQPLSLQQKIQVQHQAYTRHYGNMIPLMFDPITQEPKYYLGPHFYIFIPTWLFAIGLAVYIMWNLRNNASTSLLITSGFLIVIFLYYYFKTGFSAPGIASSRQPSDFTNRASDRYCVPCRIVRPLRTQHCYYCDVCITEMDHHCPWIGKCVGKDNILLFYKFIASCGFMLASLLVTAVTATPQTPLPKPTL